MEFWGGVLMLRWLLLAGLLLNGLCCGVGLAADEAGDPAGAYRGKKILWVDSYHPGYPWTDGVGRGIEQGLAGSGVQLKVWHMDTKRNRSEVYGRHAGRLAETVILEFDPDLVIASDDNAQKYLVVPHLKGRDLPVVFCGVNRDLVEYGYPCRNLTGVREVVFVRGLCKQMRSFAGGNRIGLLHGDTETDRIVTEKYQKLLGPSVKAYQVSDFAEYQQVFLRAQQEVDLLLLSNYVGIDGWEDEAAETFLAEQTRIPTGSVNSWMKKFVIFTFANYPEEQGELAALAALRILAGEQPENIPVAQNDEAHVTVNLKMAEVAGIVLPVSRLQTAEVIGQEALQD
jgi:ABC-type uncharacterized transport system substrate-binding protein